MQHPPLSATSPSFLNGVRGRDEAAWKRFSRLYGPLVYRWLRQASLSPADAEDVLQEVFVAVAHSIGRLEFKPGTGSFRRWLRGIAGNKLKQFFQKAADAPRAIGGSGGHRQWANLPAIADELPSTDGEASARQSEPTAIPFDEEASLLHRALGLLKSDFEEQTWRAFWRMAVDGRTSVEVAEELGMSKKAVRQAKYRVLRRLRDELDAP